jgi:hypothetical protein
MAGEFARRARAALMAEGLRCCARRGKAAGSGALLGWWLFDGTIAVEEIAIAHDLLRCSTARVLIYIKDNLRECSLIRQPKLKGRLT